MIEWYMIFWGADFLENVVGLSKVNAATMMSLFFGAMVLGRVAGSRLSRTMSSPTLLLVDRRDLTGGRPIFRFRRTE